MTGTQVLLTAGLVLSSQGEQGTLGGRTAVGDGAAVWPAPPPLPRSPIVLSPPCPPAVSCLFWSLLKPGQQGGWGAATCSVASSSGSGSQRTPWSPAGFLQNPGAGFRER